MFRAERSNEGDDLESLKVILEAFNYDLKVCMPCIVQTFYVDTMTIDAQPAIQCMNISNFQQTPTSFPLLTNIPLYSIGGPTAYITYPIHEGDEVLVLFGDRAIDSWWQQGGEQPPIMLRAHDLSDGMAICHLRSHPNRIKNYNNDAIEIRTANDTAKVTVGGDGNVTIDTKNSGKKIILKADINDTESINVVVDNTGVVINGNLTVNGDISSSKTISASTDVTVGSISLKSHKHGTGSYTAPSGGGALLAGGESGTPQ